MCALLSCNVYIAAAYPVVINDSVVVVKAKEGSSVTLDCRLEISALNNIEVIWKKNSSVSLQPVSSDDYSLVLTNVNPSHTGIYICEGTAKRHLSCDDNLCTKKTFTYLEVEKFSEFYLFKQSVNLVLRYYCITLNNLHLVLNFSFYEKLM